MLTITDVGEEVLQLHQQSKETASGIVDLLGDRMIIRTVPAQSRLEQECDGSLVYVKKGMCKYFRGAKFIRFYSSGDLLLLSGRRPDGTTVVAEFAATLGVCDCEEFKGRLAADPKLTELWTDYRTDVDTIMHGICAAYVGEDFTPEIDLREFAKGDVIIREGEHPDSLFEMIEGSAAVSTGGTQVGAIRRGEVFGEISFLTESRRTATVTAEEHCMVQAINGRDFEKIVTYRPTLMRALSKTLAVRLTEVNDRLVRIASLT